MGLLKSIENVPGINFYDYRDYDYYNKYAYRVRITLLGMRQVSYSKNATDLTNRVTNAKYSYGYSNSERNEIRQNLPTLVKIMEWKVNAIKEKKSTIRGEHNSLSIFSNDLAFLHTLDLIPNISIDYTEVQKSTFAGVKHFVKEPKHKFRVYMKSKRISEDFIKEWKDMLERIDGLYPSPALQSWLDDYIGGYWTWKYRWSNASHSIDYDDESTLSYLALMHGDILGKRYKLEKRPEEV